MILSSLTGIIRITFLQAWSGKWRIREYLLMIVQSKHVKLLKIWIFIISKGETARWLWVFLHTTGLAKNLSWRIKRRYYFMKSSTITAINRGYFVQTQASSLADQNTASLPQRVLPPATLSLRRKTFRSSPFSDTIVTVLKNTRNKWQKWYTSDGITRRKMCSVSR